MNAIGIKKMMEREVERIVKSLVEERTILKILRTLERMENRNYFNNNEVDNGFAYYSRRYKTWVLQNDCFQLN